MVIVEEDEERAVSLAAATRADRVTVWTRLRWELSPSYHFFSLEEPPAAKTEPPAVPPFSDAAVRIIDVEQSFGGAWRGGNYQRLRQCRGACMRMFLLVWALQVLYLDVSTYPPHNLYIYMGYLTHWGHVLTTLYLSLSLLCSCCAGCGGRSKNKEDPQEKHPTTVPNSSLLIRWTWALYSTVAPLEICITLMYWTAVHNYNDDDDNHGPPPSIKDMYITVMEHGGLALFVLLDGLVIGLVPVRIKQVLFLQMVCLCYFVWSIVDAVCDIGNGEWGPAYDDDALYPVLNWKTQSKTAAIVSAVCMFVLAPAVFFTCWILSLVSYSKPTTTSPDENEQLPSSCGGRGWMACRNFDLSGSRRPLLPLPSNSEGLNGKDTEAFGYKLDKGVTA